MPLRMARQPKIILLLKSVFENYLFQTRSNVFIFQGNYDMENSDWYDHVVAGIQYLKTAVKGQSRPEVFTNELTYNLIALSLEKLLVGLSLYHGKIPQHHRLDSLVQAVAKIEPMEAELIKNIQALDDYQNICSLEVYQLPVPNDLEIRSMFEIAGEVEHFVKQSIEKKGVASLKNRSMFTHFKKAFV